MKKKAFTLVELLVVIAIIAILATAGIVGYTVFTEKARKSNAESELNQIKTLIQTEDLGNNDFTIESGTATFAGYYCINSAAAANDEGDHISSDEYAALDEAEKAYYQASNLSLVAKYSEDEELAKVADKLSYDAGKITMTSTSNSKYEAVWDLATGTVTGKKKS